MKSASNVNFFGQTVLCAILQKKLIKMQPLIADNRGKTIRFLLMCTEYAPSDNTNTELVSEGPYI